MNNENKNKIRNGCCDKSRYASKFRYWKRFVEKLHLRHFWCILRFVNQMNSLIQQHPELISWVWQLAEYLQDCTNIG